MTPDSPTLAAIQADAQQLDAMSVGAIDRELAALAGVGAHADDPRLAVVAARRQQALLAQRPVMSTPQP